MHASVIERFGKASSPSSSNQRRGRSVDKPAVAVATGPSVVFKFRADQTVVAYPAERFEVGQLFADRKFHIRKSSGRKTATPGHQLQQANAFA
ncbi:hypothetical protein B2M20_17430 [Nitrobacter vulgaris]|uniref:Uncharacterized protein n=1 Tax=Nitrobacter vulgaris TaxID=29421 RepID=A0A1V4HU17_NITVU|nr:hypothetical protein B2M20_17430 [Nitrobacter vulgaris]